MMDQAEIKRRLATVAHGKQMKEEMRLADLGCDIYRTKRDLEDAKNAYAVCITQQGLWSRIISLFIEKQIACIENRLANMQRAFDEAAAKSSFQ